MIAGHAGAPAATYALAHALWQGAAIAAGYAAGARGVRSAAGRHALGMMAVIAMALAPAATFALYHRPGPAVATAGAELPTMIHGTAWLAVIAPLVWLAGVVVIAARQVIGWAALVALGRRGAAPGAWALRIDELRRALGIARPVAVRTGAGLFTAHAWRPIVWLPAGWAALPAAQRDALAAHELAHVRRLDWIWNAVQCAVEAALWFHPATRWLGQRVRQEREHACDDVAVATCRDPIALVEGLVALEHDARRLALAAGGGALVERTRRLLATPSPPRAPWSLLGGFALGVALVLVLRLPHDMLLGLRVDASGGHRDITTDAFLDHRHYHGEVDAAGALHERYDADGVPRPIDPAVRAWLDELIAIDAR